MKYFMKFQNPKYNNTLSRSREVVYKHAFVYLNVMSTEDTEKPKASRVYDFEIKSDDFTNFLKP